MCIFLKEYYFFEYALLILVSNEFFYIAVAKYLK